MNLNELIIKNENELTDTQKEFLNCHNNIIISGNLIGQSLINLAIKRSENLC